MTLPHRFTDFEDYFEQSVLFFQEYQHLYNFANTDILVKGVLENIDVTNLENEEVTGNLFNSLEIARENGFVDNFLCKSDKLQADYVYVDKRLDFKFEIDVPLSPKKEHEIIYFAEEIKQLCDKVKCDTVVDFGSGLGYLDHVIFDMTKSNVLGLECNESHYVGAKKRQRKYHLSSTGSVKYIRHTITDQSHTQIGEFLNDKFPNCKSFCITGLHACADLTVDAINIFLKMSDAKAMILMPCCYHKMRLDILTSERFSNFPLSNCLKNVYEKYSGFEYMRIPFLRLAAQPKLGLEADMESLVFNLLARAVLQLYAHKHNLKLKRRKRKAVKVKTIHNEFETYARDACFDGFLFVKNNLLSTDCVESAIHVEKNTPDEVCLEEVISIWRNLPEVTFKKAAVFIMLQNFLQPIIENFVLLDRIVYLKEKGLIHSGCLKIVNEKISPRCLALYAYK